MNKSEIIATLLQWGWTEDRYGNMVKRIGTKNVRVKLKERCARIEKQVFIVDKNEWIRVDSQFYGKIKAECDKITFSSVSIKKPRKLDQ